MAKNALSRSATLWEERDILPMLAFRKSGQGMPTRFQPTGTRIPGWQGPTFATSQSRRPMKIQKSPTCRLKPEFSQSRPFA